MGIIIEGNDVSGYRVVDEEIGPLTGRQRSEADALKVAGLDESALEAAPKAKAAPRAKAAPKAKAAAESEQAAEAVTTESGE